ncbi:hypothetical protein P7H22_24785 [Paenibacillus larvae]|nr:hypothetical protein [Paenibacillus larvae]MDT2242902.1 hypothetical protein [Paenibacillus larvae]
MDFESIRKNATGCQLKQNAKDNRSAIRAIQAGKMIEVRLNQFLSKVLV